MECIKIILLTECFLVLNILSSLEAIAKGEQEMFAVKLKSAREICCCELQKFDGIDEVREYLTNKLSPGVVTKKISINRAASLLGICSNPITELAREVITKYFYVHIFFRHWQKELDAAATTNKTKKEKTTKIKKMDGSAKKELAVLGPATEVEQGTRNREQGGGEQETENEEQGGGLLVKHDFVLVGAAFSVMKQDQDLAQLVEEYLDCLGNFFFLKLHLTVFD